MATCPHCGQAMPAPVSGARVSDHEIILALNSRDGMQLYAAGRPDGSADMARWYITYGKPKGPFTREQVMRVVKLAGLVEAPRCNGSAFMFPEHAERWLAKIEANEARQRRKAAPSQGGRAR